MSKSKYVIVLIIIEILINKYNQYISIHRLVVKEEESRKKYLN